MSRLARFQVGPAGGAILKFKAPDTVFADNGAISKTFVLTRAKKLY